MTTFFHPYACFSCRRSFRRKASVCGPEATCPACGATAVRMNRKFKPPPRSDQEHWRMVEYLFAHGFRFESIYVDNVTVPYPSTFEEARAFVRRFGPLRPRRIFETGARRKAAPHPKRAVYERLFRPAKRKRRTRA